MWILNDGAEFQFDYWTSCTLDYVRNALFCGANLRGGTFQNTVVSINTITGVLNWAVNLGSIHSRPALGNPSAGGVDHLYVADATGRLHALDPDTGKEHWNLRLSGDVGVPIENCADRIHARRGSEALGVRTVRRSGYN